MRILGICGTNKRGSKKSASEWFLKKALEAAAELGAETESIRLINCRITPCLACNFCMCGKLCPLLEDPKDDAKEIFTKIDKAAGIIFSFPVYGYQTPAIVINLLQRTRPFHELERAKATGLEIKAVKNNPFSGKAIGSLTVAAAIGLEGALFGPLHILKALGATPVACAGISLLDPEIKNIYSIDGKFCVPNENIKAFFDRDFPSYEENECAIDMARSVGKWVYTACKSEVFQRIRYRTKL